MTASANKVYLSVANQDGLSQRYDLTVPPGLYGSLDDVQLALANDAVDQGLFGVRLRVRSHNPVSQENQSR